MLRILPHSPLPAATSPYEEIALEFCQKWLDGQQEFTLHTSGSTGQPKAIVLTRTQLVASARLTGQALGLGAGDEALCCLNVAYIAGTMMLVRALELGLTLTIVEPASNPLKGNFQSNEVPPVAFAAFVPLQLQTLLEGPPESLHFLHAMKGILVGGAVVSPLLETQIQTLNAPVYSTYGMTETVSHVALRRLNGEQRSESYHLLPGVEAGLDDRNCLWVRGGMTDFQTIQTNDIVEWTSPRDFRWLGRWDNVINSGGVKVHPELVEQRIGEVLQNARFFICSTPDERLGQQVTVVIESQPWTTEQQEALKSELNQRLGRYELPRQWLFVIPFAETPTGKIDRLRTLNMARNSQTS